MTFSLRFFYPSKKFQSFGSNVIIKNRRAEFFLGGGNCQYELPCLDIFTKTIFSFGKCHAAFGLKMRSLPRLEKQLSEDKKFSARG